MKKAYPQSNSLPVLKRPPALISILCILIAITAISVTMSFRCMRLCHKICQDVKPLMKQNLELAQLIDIQQAAVNVENIAIAAELKKPKEEQAADLGTRLKLNTERTEAIRDLIRQQEELLDTLRKTEVKLGIVPQKDGPEARAVLEKY